MYGDGLISLCGIIWYCVHLLYEFTFYGIESFQICNLISSMGLPYVVKHFNLCRLYIRFVKNTVEFGMKLLIFGI